MHKKRIIFHPVRPHISRLILPFCRSRTGCIFRAYSQSVYSNTCTAHLSPRFAIYQRRFTCVTCDRQIRETCEGGNSMDYSAARDRCSLRRTPVLEGFLQEWLHGERRSWFSRERCSFARCLSRKKRKTFSGMLWRISVISMTKEHGGGFLFTCSSRIISDLTYSLMFEFLLRTKIANLSSDTKDRDACSSISRDIKRYCAILLSGTFSFHVECAQLRERNCIREMVIARKRAVNSGGKEEDYLGEIV